jgi:hypothetical protein
VKYGKRNSFGSDNMKTDKFNLKVGDWVILEESFLNNKRSRKTNKILDMFSYPQKIQVIHQKKEWPSRKILKFSRDKRGHYMKMNFV